MKIIIRIAIVVLVLTTGLILAGLYYIDAIASAAIETGASYALGVKTTVAETDIGVFSGHSEIKGLNVANPESYTSPHLMLVNRGAVDVSYSALREEVARLPRLTIDGVDMNIEKREGKTNINVITDNLKRFESEDKPATDKEGKKFVIDELLITNVMVHTEVLPIGGELSRADVPIDEIRLTNVGSGADGGVKMSQLTGVIFKAILAAVVKNGMDLPGDLVADLGNGLSGLKPLGDFGKDLFSGSGETLGDAGKGIEDLGKGLGEGLGNLLGGDKNKDDK